MTSIPLPRRHDTYSYHLFHIAVLLTMSVWLSPILPFAQIATEVIRTSDNEKLVTILESGNVGIGVADPMSRLHIAGTAQMTGFKMPTGAMYGYVLTSDATGSGTWQETQLVGVGGGGTAGYLPRFAGSTMLGNSSLYQDNDGEIGIGTLVPDRPLVINGPAAAMAITDYSMNSNPSIFMENDMRPWQIFIDGGNHMTDGFAIRDVGAGAERFIIDTNGDVAIGDFDPVSKLHVGGTVRATAFTSSSPLYLQTDGITRIYADDITGHVGIGTVSPGSELDIAGTAGMTGFMMPTGAMYGYVLTSDATGSGTWQATQLVGIGGGGTTNFLPKYTGMTTLGNSGIFEDGMGNVGIGEINPGTKLSVNGTARAGAFVGRDGEKLVLSGYDDGLGGGYGIEYDAVEGGHDFQTYNGGWSSRLFIADNGNVGISTMSPGDKLHVLGTVRASAFSSSSPLLLQTNGTTRIYVNDVTGNVGIGTTNPGYKFHMVSTTANDQLRFESSVSNGNPSIVVKANSPAGYASVIADRADTGSEAYFQLSNNGTGLWRFRTPDFLSSDANRLDLVNTSGTSVMTFKQSGNIGIGIVDPVWPLDVYSASSNSVPLNINSTHSNAIGIKMFNRHPNKGWYFATAGGSGNFELRTFDEVSTRLTVAQATGNVGIGTINPGYKLHLVSTSANDQLRFESSVSNGNPSIVVKANSPAGYASVIADRADTGSEAYFQLSNNGTGLWRFRTPDFLSSDANRLDLVNTSGTSVMTFKQTGNIGIGTPDPGDRLHVVGTVRASAFSSTSPLLLQTNGMTRIYVDDVSGNVGVGTTTPAQKLDVAGELRSAADMIIGPGTDKTLWFNTTDAFLTRARIGFYFDGSNNNLDLAAIDGTSNIETARILLSQNNTMLFRTANSEAMRIASDGNVGIGTVSPEVDLQVRGANEDAAEILFSLRKDGTAGANAIYGRIDAANRIGQIFTDGSSGVPRLSLGAGASAPEHLTIIPSGNVGIGHTNPAHPLVLASGAHCTDGGVWTDASSRSLKENITALSYSDALDAFGNLTPVRYNYISEPDEEYLGFIAEDVPDLVATNSRQGIAPMDMVALLVSVVQAQQEVIENQKKELQTINRRLEKLEELLKK